MGIDSRAGSTDDVKDNASAVDLKEIFKTVQTMLVIDWPSKELPATLTRAGFQVVVRRGPGPEDYSAYELTLLGASHMTLAKWWSAALAARPSAKRLGAQTIWTQSGLSAAGVIDPKGCWVPQEELRLARNLVESAGLRYIRGPYIGGAAQR